MNFAKFAARQLGSNRNIIRLTLVVSVVVLVLIPYLVIWSEATLYGPAEIEKVARESVAGTTNKSQVVENIERWIYYNITFGVISSYPPFTLRIYVPGIIDTSQNPYWIMAARRGNCGEYATLFVAIAKAAGIDATVVGNLGQNHGWNEYYDTSQGRWIQVDVGSLIIDQPHYYESEGTKMNFVYSYRDGVFTDDTASYANPATVGNLTIDFGDFDPDSSITLAVQLDGGGLQPGVSFAVNRTTGCELVLGSGDYTLTATSAAGNVSTGHVTVQPNSNVQFTMPPPAPDVWYLLTVVEWIAAPLVLSFLLFLAWEHGGRRAKRS